MAWLTINTFPLEGYCQAYFYLPITFTSASSLSYDVMIIALSAYFTAVCLDLCELPRVGIYNVRLLAAVDAIMGPEWFYGVITGLACSPGKEIQGKMGAVSGSCLGAFATAMLLVNHST